MQARYYDPVIGRFYSNDPIGFRDVHSFNRYAYANNNPYKYNDPDGEAAVLAVPAAVGVIILTGCNLSQGCSDSLRGVAKDLVSLLDFSSMFNESGEDAAKGKITDLVGENPTGEDLQDAPGEGWEWKGNPNAPVGSAQGAWVNPETGEQIHNDLDTHQEGTKRGPHVTYTDEDGKRWDYFPKEDKIEQQ